ncbi:MAG: response regulator [Myxococcales bacterium]|nr:response regulator [Myxococcales bacterium]
MPSAIIVDDSPIMRAQLRKLLGAAEFSIAAETGTGDSVLALYEQHRPDLVTLDIVMPGRDGASVAAELLLRFPEANVVMCTSLSTREKIEVCRRAGVKYYLLKPFKPEAAIAVFRRVLAKRTAMLPRLEDESDALTTPPEDANGR